MIQIIELLDDLGIKYKTFGKNVSRDWVEISCPFCDDHSEHCGVSLQKQGFNCWVCGAKGSIFKLIMEIENCTYHQAKITVEKFSDSLIYQPQEKTPAIGHTNRNIIPKEASSILPSLHLNYLRKRNFDPTHIQKEYKIMACDILGNFAYRIIIPIILNEVVISFTGRDVTGKQENKYKNCPNELSQFSIKETIYNIDTVKNKMIICEGPTDVWRIGRGAVATMGVEYTTSQLVLIAQKEPKEIYILYDSDATKTETYGCRGELITKIGPSKAEKLASAVSTFCSKVEILELNEGDPADMSTEETTKLRKEIGI